MRFHVWASLLGLALASSPAAQTALNEFGIYPNSTTFTSRNNLPGPADGDVLQGISSPLCNGVGQITVGSTIVGRLNGFRVVIQDQNAATQETYTHVLVPANTSGTPDIGAAPILRTGALTTPSGTGTIAWSITADLATPADVIPQTGDWFYGVGLTINATWTADGASVHGASNATGTLGDNAHPSAPNRMFTINRTTSALTVQPTLRSSAMFLRLEGAVLRTCQDVIAAAQRGPNPTYGWGGVYPYLTRPAGGDGIGLQLTDLVNANGVAGLFLSGATLPAALPIGGISGGLWLSPAGLTSIATVGLSSTGAASLVIAPQGSLPPLVGQIFYQAFTISPAFTNPRFSYQSGQCFLP